VVWRQFKASEDGKRAFNERNGEVAKATKPKTVKPSNSDLVRELEAAKAHIAELEAARPVTPNAGDLDAARRAYVSLLPTDPCNARTELAVLTQELGKITELVGVGGGPRRPTSSPSCRTWPTTCWRRRPSPRSSKSTPRRRRC